MESLFSRYEEIRKSGLFDPEYYLAANPDVAERNLDPLVHYLEEGARQGRNPNPGFDSAFYLEQCRRAGEEPENPLLHYLRSGAGRDFKTRRDGGSARSGEARQPILVAIEALGVLAGPGDTSRVSIAGWALASGPIAEITVSDGDEMLAVACYGSARPDIARLYPTRPGADRSGFILAFDIPNRGRHAFEPVLTVRSADDTVGHRPLPVELPPRELEVGTVDPLAPAAAALTTQAAEPMRLTLDKAVVASDGKLHVAGWVVSRVQIEAVEVLIDGVSLGAAAFGIVQPDVEKAHPDFPNSRFSGFALIADAASYGAGSRVVTVRAVARAGQRRETAAAVQFPRRVARRAARMEPAFRYHLDQAGLTADRRLRLGGWIVSAMPVASIRVLIDGEEIGEARLGVERPDVGNLFPDLPQARRAGFFFDSRFADADGGGHELLLRVLLENGEAREVGRSLTAAGITGSGTVTDGDRKLHIDSPQVIDGALLSPVRGRLDIDGWAVARAGVAELEIAIDGVPIAAADYGLRRLDVRASHPDWPDSVASGFSARLPQRVLPVGNHAVAVMLHDKTGGSTRTSFRIEVEKADDLPGPWSLRRTMAPAEIDLTMRIIERAGLPPVFGALMMLGAEPAAAARRTIASLVGQAYPRWRLWLVGERTEPAVELAKLDQRIEIVEEARLPLPSEDGSPDFFTALSPGDELGVDAFLEMAVAAAQYRGADFLYSDERCRNPSSDAVEAFFKPDWSPDLLAASNYIGRLWCARIELVRQIAAGEALFAEGEYDLVLRCTEAAKSIRHVRAVLCERAEEAAADPDQTKAALRRACERRGIAAQLRPGKLAGSWRLKRELTRPGLVSIVIPTCAAGGLIETCIRSLRRLTAYRDYEIVCVENIPPPQRKWRDWLRRNADRVVSATGPFNWSRFNNLAVAASGGEYLLFLNDDIEITDPDWLDAMLEEAQRPEIGVVGPRLLYPDGQVQHAGMFLAAMAQGRHAFRYAAADDPGYFGLALSTRNVIAVTGACLLTRRETFEALGGFDERQSIVNNDLDFCLRAWRSGLRNVYTPHATLTHHEAASRAALDDEYDAAAFDSEWRDLFLAGDPYFSPHLSKQRDDFAVDDEPTRMLVTGRPALRREAIRNILAVKLDHIGDCVIAFPAVRRLKQHFPEARLTVLTSPASRPVWQLEPGVDRTIEFEFFHPRSELGERELNESDWQALRDRLAPERFDLAIDLRKHTETRPVLQHTGARHLAGFDFRNQFPWLDVAIEWTGDQIYARKRQHNGDDLINLVDAVAAACDGAREVIAPRPAPPASAAAPLVCVHPAAGNVMKQWPVENFAWVIDRLIEAAGAQVILIGAPGEEEIAADILRLTPHRRAIRSLVGKMPLAELPKLLSQASLFLGNDSGPKHIAAGLGIPTVGVHAGSVDVREWGPVGPAAVAVAREVNCSPCYLAHIEDCRRGLACLREIEPAPVYEACMRLLTLGLPARSEPDQAEPAVKKLPSRPANRSPAARRRSR